MTVDRYSFGHGVRRVPSGRGAGFSLIEVSLAIMLIAVGLLVLFSLFPAGLKQGDSAYRDTQSALFADYIINAIRANVDGIDEWDEWDAMGTFAASAVAGLPVVPTGTSVPLEFPTGTGNYVRYMLSFGDLGDRRSVSLWVWGGRYGPADAVVFRRRAQWFYTEFYYMGAPDA